jgi:hypothetical protein
MKKITLTVKADISDKIVVPTLDLKDAVVLAIYHTRYSTTYEVGYFHNGDRKTAYLYDHEFELKT